MTTMDATKAAERLREMRDDKSHWASKSLTERRIWRTEWTKHAAVVVADYLSEHDPTPITEEWLRSVGFRDKTYQDETKLAYSLPSPLTDSQWIEATSGMPSLFLLCRFSPMYDDDTPPDRFQVVIETRGAMRRLLTELGAPEATP